MKLLNNPSPLFEAVRAQKSSNPIKGLLDLPCRVGLTTVTSKAEMKEAWRDCLYQSVDVRELNTPPLDYASHFWLKYPKNVFPRLHLQGSSSEGECTPQNLGMPVALIVLPVL